MYKEDEDSNILKAKGFQAINFAYQVGGGEDENDMIIFVKDNIAVRFDYQKHAWYSCKWDSCNYVNGFDYVNEILFYI